MAAQDVTLRRRRQWSAVAVAAVMALVQADLAALEISPVPLRVVSAVLAVAFAGLVARLLWPPLAIRVTRAGIEVGRLTRRPALRRWVELGDATLTTTGSGRRLILRPGRRRRRAVVVREDQVVGSVDAVLARLQTAGIAVRQRRRRLRPGRRLAMAGRWARRLAGVVIITCLLAVAPLPGRYARSPGQVRAAADVLLPHTQTAGRVHLVIAHTGPASLWTVLTARHDDAIEIGSASEILGPAPTPVNAEIERQLTATAAKEAIVAAWRHAGVPVALKGAGVELVTVPPALASYLRPEDVVVAVGDQPTTTRWDFSAALDAVGDEPVRLTLRRGDDRREVTMPPGWLAAATGKLFFAPAEVEVVGAPRTIEIDHRGLAGDSAGLPWALAALERIQGVELGEGHGLVAATGAVTADGVVHEVGAIPQKAATATRAGATVFLVPESLAALARQHVGPRVRVVGVTTLAEAVEALAAR